MKRSQQICIDDFHKIFLRHSQQQFIICYSGIVDEDIDLPEFLNRLFYGLLCISSVGHIAFGRDDFRTVLFQFGGGFRSGIFIAAVTDHNIRTLFCELLRDPETDSPNTPGNNRAFPF